jgi:hypothetical protein
LFGGSVGFFRYQDAAGVSQLLHTIRQVNIRSRGIIGLVNSVLYRLNNDFTGVNANADLQIRIAEACYLILHCQRREAATDCVILVRLRRAKQSHDSIALGFVDDAIVTNNGFIHEIENGLQASHPQFGIAQTINKAG